MAVRNIKYELGTKLKTAGGGIFSKPIEKEKPD
jgi:hypothetical protein